MYMYILNVYHQKSPVSCWKSPIFFQKSHISNQNSLIFYQIIHTRNYTCIFSYIYSVCVYTHAWIYVYTHTYSCVYLYEHSTPQKPKPNTPSSSLELFIHIDTEWRIIFIPIDAEWRRPIGCLITQGHFPQKSPTISGSFAENCTQLYKWLCGGKLSC